jgi:hypothetical protein
MNLPRPVTRYPDCASNARLRQVVEAKDTEIAALRSALEAARARQDELIRRQVELTKSLELRVAELERRLGIDSGKLLHAACEGAAGGDGTREGGAAGGAAGAVEGAQAGRAAGSSGLGPGTGG